MNDLDVLERQLGPGLRRTLDAVLSPERGQVVGRRTPDRHDRRPRRRFVVLATAAALCAGIAATAIAVANRQDSDPATPAGTPDSEPATAHTLADAPVVGTAANDVAGTDAPPSDAPTADAVSDVVGIALPALPVDGFTVSDISVERPATAPVSQQVDRYLRSGADGRSAMLTVAAQPASQEAIDDDSGSITVHGASAHIFDSGAGVVVQWTEAATAYSLRGIDIGWNEMAAYAEASVLAADGSVSVPGLDADGFTLPSAATPPPDDAVTTLVELLPDDRTPGLFVSVAVRPNDSLATIETMAAELQIVPTMEYERTTVGGAPALVATSPADDLGAMTIVEWLRDGFHLSVTSRLPREDVLAIAESVAPATLADARALAGDVQARLGALTELDRATLPNGFEVSVHSSGSGANAICLHRPIARCEPATSESSLLGEQQSQAVVPIAVDGVTWQVGWAEGTHHPVWADGAADAESLTGTAQGTAGTFVAFTSTSASAGVRFDAGELPIYPAADPLLDRFATVDLLDASVG